MDKPSGIQSVQYGVYSPHDVIDGSVCEVNNANLYKLGQPVEGGLFDARMGTMIPSMLCMTCGQNDMLCPGHFGHIRLKAPVINIEFMSILYKVIGCVCFHCSQLLILPSHRKYHEICQISNKKGRLAAWSTICRKQRTCPNMSMGKPCSGQQPTFERDDVIIRIREPEFDLTMEKLWCILQFIPRETIRLLGFNDVHSPPVNFLWVHLIVPPPCMRPSIPVQHMRGDVEDSLTTRLKLIVRSNNALKDIPWKDVRYDNDHYLALCKAVASYQDGKNRSEFYEVYGHTKSVRDRFAPECAKKGTLRGSVFGKRQNYCARSVITPDPFLAPDEVGVPTWMCRIVTYPERVTSFNIRRLQKAVQVGPYGYPGANSFAKKAQVDREYSLQAGQAYRVKLGDIVRRHLVDGDHVLLNRQPSLHKMSILGHVVRVIPGHSLRIPLAVTHAYNADFDGDEMNLMALQSQLTRAEASELVSVRNNLLKDGKAVVSFVQHSVLGAYLLCCPDRYLTFSEVCEMYAQIGEMPAHLPEPSPSPTYLSGRALFSACLPPSVYVKMAGLEIRNSLLIECDKMNKDKLNKILAIIAKDISYDAAFEFVKKGTRLFEYVTRCHGTSIGIDDCFYSLDDIAPQIIQRAETAFNNLPTPTLQHDNEICALFDVTRDILTSRISQRRKFKQNNLFRIIDSGAKGNITNISQISAMLGQQRNYAGTRLRHIINHDIPMSTKEGFVKEPFITGLSTPSVFSHLKASRVGLIDTSVKTADTGYSQRRLTKALEDITINACGSAVMYDRIIQFKYGDDGCHTDRLSKVELHFHTLSYHDLVTLFQYRENHLCPPLPTSQIAHELSKLLQLRESLLQISSKMIVFRSPIPYDRLLHRAQHQLSDEPPLTPVILYEVVQQTWTYLTEHFLTDTLYMQAAFFWFFSTYNLRKIQITHETLVHTLKNVLKYAQISRISPHENIGVMTSQNCTEPLTQLTLNTFHQSGQFSHLLSGVKRMREIMNCSKSIQTPIMFITLPKGGRQTPEEFGTDLIHVELHEVTTVYRTQDSVLTITLNKSLCCYHLLSPTNIYRHISTTVPDTRLIHISDVENPQWSISLEFIGNNINVYDVWTRNISSIVLKGVVGIQDFCVTEESTSETVLMTKGCNLPMLLQSNDICTDRLRTNHIYEVYQTMGIDAFRHAMIQEWAGVMNANDINVGIRHIMLIADAMTYQGYPTPINYQGICNHPDVPIIKKASFEKTMESLIYGAAAGQRDSVNSVAASICFNSLATHGSGSISLVHETYRIPDSLPIIPQESSRPPPLLYHLKAKAENITERIRKRSRGQTPLQDPTALKKPNVIAKLFFFSKCGSCFSPFEDVQSPQESHHRTL